MNDNSTYNGWTNYATWRVQLELISDYVNSQLEDHDTAREWADMDSMDLGDQLHDYADEAISNFGEIPEDSLAIAYAGTFLTEVNWLELAEHAIEDATERLEREEVRQGRVDV